MVGRFAHQTASQSIRQTHNVIPMCQCAYTTQYKHYWVAKCIHKFTWKYSRENSLDNGYTTAALPGTDGNIYAIFSPTFIAGRNEICSTILAVTRVSSPDQESVNFSEISDTTKDMIMPQSQVVFLFQYHIFLLWDLRVIHKCLKIYKQTRSLLRVNSKQWAMNNFLKQKALVGFMLHIIGT